MLPGFVDGLFSALFKILLLLAAITAVAKIVSWAVRT